MREAVFVFIYGYLPGKQYGGPVTSIYNFSEHFGDKYDIRVVCSNHDHCSKDVYPNIKEGWNQVGKAKVMYLSESQYKADLFYDLMKSFDVKMVYLTGVFSYVLNHAAIKAARKKRVLVVTATRGEILKNILAMKSYKKIPYLFIMKTVNEFKDVFFQITSDEEHEQLVKYLNVPEDRILMLPNIHGRTLDLPRPTKASGSAKMLFISRIHPKKNLLDAIKAANKVSGNLEFDIYGPIEDEAYWNTCKNEMGSAPPNVVFTYGGLLDMEAAIKIYYGYHAFVFPTLSENYGHVIVEAMIANSLVCISKGTTPWDDLSGRGGYVTELYDVGALANAMQEIVDMSAEAFSIAQQKQANYRDEKLHLEELLDGYEKMIKINSIDDLTNSVNEGGVILLSTCILCFAVNVIQTKFVIAEDRVKTAAKEVAA